MSDPLEEMGVTIADGRSQATALLARIKLSERDRESARQIGEKLIEAVGHFYSYEQSHQNPPVSPTAATAALAYALAYSQVVMGGWD